MSAANVAIDPKTNNPVIRTTPEHKIKNVYAKNGMVVIVGDVGGKDVERIVDRREAIARAQALNEMADKSKYSSDRDELQNLVCLFIEAIKQAAEQAGKPYKAISVSMTSMGKK
jgi:hypothetical protein